MERLARVEVQAIMQLLDHASLLLLARCSRRLHSDASSDVVWQHGPVVPPPRVVSLTPSNLDFGARIRGSLLRHCPGVAVKCVASSEWIADSRTLSGLHAIPRLLRVDLAATEYLFDEWHTLMRHEALDTLREMHITYTHWLPIGFLRELVRLPHLHTLHLDGHLPQGDPIIDLPLLANLTSLHLSDYDAGGPDVIVGSRLPTVEQCEQLVDLGIVWPQLHGDRFKAFFTSPKMSRLERLALNMFQDYSDDHTSPIVSEEDFGVSFRSLTRLRSLSCAAVEGINSMLSQAHLAPALVEVALTVHGFDDDITVPSPDVLSTLMDRAPNLRIRLEEKQTESATNSHARSRFDRASQPPPQPRGLSSLPSRLSSCPPALRRPRPLFPLQPHTTRSAATRVD